MEVVDAVERQVKRPMGERVSTHIGRSDPDI
jgi:hypothetical protein